MIFKLLAEFNCKEECDQYRQQLFRQAVLTTNTNNYTIWEGTEHKMRVQYINCSNENCVVGRTENCPKSYKIQTCSRDRKFNGKLRLFQRGDYNSKIDSKVTYGIIFYHVFRSVCRNLIFIIKFSQ